MIVDTFFSHSRHMEGLAVFPYGAILFYLIYLFLLSRSCLLYVLMWFIFICDFYFYFFTNSVFDFFSHPHMIYLFSCDSPFSHVIFLARLFYFHMDLFFLICDFSPHMISFSHVVIFWRWFVKQFIWNLFWFISHVWHLFVCFFLWYFFTLIVYFHSWFFFLIIFFFSD